MLEETGSGSVWFATPYGAHALKRDGGFESGLLQQRVHVSRDFALPRREAGFFARVCGPGRCGAVSRDGYRAVRGADRREYLCRAKFQYAASMRWWLNEFRSGSGKAEHGPLLVRARQHRANCR